MDPLIAASMIFSIVVLLVIGGFITLFPVSRRLGRVLEVWLSKQADARSVEGKLRETQEVLGQVIARLERLEERQEFVEDLLRRRPQGAALPPGGPGEREPGTG